MTAPPPPAPELFPNVAPTPAPAPESNRPAKWTVSRFLPRTLGTRLVLFVVALVVFLVGSIGTATYLAVRSSLGHRLDQQLESTVSSQQALTDMLTQPTEPISGIQSPQQIWALYLPDSGGKLGFTGSGFVRTISLTDAQCAVLKARSDPGPTSVSTTTGAHLRVVTRHLAGQFPGTLVVGFSTAEERRTLRQLLVFEVLIGGAGVLAAFVVTGYGVNLNLRRLKYVTATAQEVAAELSPDGAGLDRRVPIVDEGTEVGQLAESMNTLLAAVETQFAARVESENRMRQFLADASHELRTPLTSIRGYAELARMQRAAGNPDEDNLGRIEAEGTRMSRLVEDLLMLARGDRDSIPRIELVDVADIVDDAVSGARAAHPERNVDVEAIPSYNVVGDPDQLMRAIRNLITNAMVHTPAGSPIRVRAFPDGPGIAIQVIDGGPGLPPDEAAHVFERFWRADKARTRARGGSGLGLSIVGTIVDAHQGATHFESTVEGGSTVTVWLPGVTP